MPSPNGTPILLKGKSYTLRYPNFSLIRLEREVGMPALQLLTQMKGGSFTAVIGLLWAGLIWEHKDLTLEDFSNSINLLEDFNEKIAVAMMAEVVRSFPQAKAQAEAAIAGAIPHTAEDGSDPKVSEAPAPSV